MSRVQAPVQDPVDRPVQRSGDHGVRLGRRLRGFLWRGGHRRHLVGGWDGAVDGRHGTVHCGRLRHHGQRGGSGVGNRIVDGTGNRIGDGIGLALNRRTRFGRCGPPTRGSGMR